MWKLEDRKRRKKTGIGQLWAVMEISQLRISTHIFGVCVCVLCLTHAFISTISRNKIYYVESAKISLKWIRAKKMREEIAGESCQQRFGSKTRRSSRTETASTKYLQNWVKELETTGVYSSLQPVVSLLSSKNTGRCFRRLECFQQTLNSWKISQWNLQVPHFTTVTPTSFNDFPMQSIQPALKLTHFI